MTDESKSNFKYVNYIFRIICVQIFKRVYLLKMDICECNLFVFIL